MWLLHLLAGCQGNKSIKFNMAWYRNFCDLISTVRHLFTLLLRDSDIMNTKCLGINNYFVSKWPSIFPDFWQFGHSTYIIVKHTYIERKWLTSGTNFCAFSIICLLKSSICRTWLFHKKMLCKSKCTTFKITTIS